MVILYIVQLCLIKYLRTKRIRRRASQTKVAVQHASPQIEFNLRDLIYSASPSLQMVMSKRLPTLLSNSLIMSSLPPSACLIEAHRAPMQIRWSHHLPPPLLLTPTLSMFSIEHTLQSAMISIRRNFPIIALSLSRIF